MRLAQLICGAVVMFALGGCAPEVGSEKWCQQLKEKPKGEWTLDETKDYAKHCIIK